MLKITVKDNHGNLIGEHLTMRQVDEIVAHTTQTILVMYDESDGHVCGEYDPRDNEPEVSDPYSKIYQ